MKQLKYILIIALILSLLSGCIEQKQNTPVTTPVSSPAVTVATPAATTAIPVTPVSEAVASGKEKLVKLESRRGFIPQAQTIEPGDVIIWNNIGVDTLTLVSADGMFNEQVMAYDQQIRTSFGKTGTYKFHLKNNPNLNGTVNVAYPPSVIQTTTPASTQPKELPPNSLYVSTRMLKPAYWSTDKYGLDSLKVNIINQGNEKLTIRTQIISDELVLEEKTFVLEKTNSAKEFTNEKTYIIKSTNVTLRLLINDYLPKDYEFVTVGSLT